LADAPAGPTAPAPPDLHHHAIPAFDAGPPVVEEHPNTMPKTADQKFRAAASMRAHYQRAKVDPDLGLRSDISALKTFARRVSRRLAAGLVALHPVDAQIAADAARTALNDAELLSKLAHPSRRVSR
jgi:hypothetical protein